MRKLGLFAVVTLLSAVSLSANEPSGRAKPDYFVQNPDGSIKSKGVYQTSEDGKAFKYLVYDNARNLQYVEIPYYASNGDIVKVERLDAKGEIERTYAYYGARVKIKSRDGTVLNKEHGDKARFPIADRE